MRKILAGFAVALLLGLPAVYFGLPWWAEQKALREVEATFDMLRRSGAKASHGALHFDTWTRTLKIADLAVQPADPAQPTLKLGQFVATGLAPAEAARFSADHIELTDLEVTGLQLGPTGSKATYRFSALTAEAFSGPTAITQRPSTVPGTESALALLDVLAAIKAAKISAPAISVSTETPVLRGAAVAPAEYEITDTVLRNIDGGKTESITVEKVTLTGQLPDQGPYTAALERIQTSDLDIGPMIAVLDPAQNKDDSYRRVYRQIATGPYRVDVGKAGKVHAGSLQIDDFAIRPAKFSDPDILTFAGTLQSKAGTVLSPAEAQAVLSKVAAVYEGVRLGQFEARDFTAEMAASPSATFGVIRLARLLDGKIAELAMEKLATRTPTDGPLTLERFAIKGIDIVRFMRTVSQLSATRSPDVEHALGLLPTIEAVELKDLRAIEQVSRQPVHIETFGFSWGQFIGPIPTQIRAASKFTFAVDPNGTDPNLRYLIDAGIKQVTADFDLGAAWNDKDKSIVVTPLAAEMSNVYGLSGKLTLNNVQDTLFSTNPLLLGMSAAQVEAGRLELTLRDLGGFDLVIAQLAREQAVTPDAMRRTMVDTINTFAAASPEIETLAAALARQLENRGATLNLVLMPKGRIGLMQAIEQARFDPLGLLSQFTIEARTDR